MNHKARRIHLKIMFLLVRNIVVKEMCLFIVVVLQHEDLRRTRGSAVKDISHLLDRDTERVCFSDL